LISFVPVNIYRYLTFMITGSYTPPEGIPPGNGEFLTSTYSPPTALLVDDGTFTEDDFPRPQRSVRNTTVTGCDKFVIQGFRIGRGELKDEGQTLGD
jgi:hypothetical protein